MTNKDLEIERLKLGEIDKTTFMKKYKCSEEEVDSELSKLQSSDEEIFSSYPVDKVKSAIEEKMKSKNKNKKILRFPKKVVSSISVAAAVLLFGILVPFQIIQNKKNISTDLFPSSVTDSIRVKGSENPALFLYKYENEQAVRLKNHSHINNGDVVQITYIAGKAKDGMIFSIDGNGVLTQHFPEVKAVSGTLQKDKEVALDFSYKLDAAPRFEKFYFVTGDEPFTSTDLKISTKTGKVSSVKRNKLEVTVFSLEK